MIFYLTLAVMPLLLKAAVVRCRARFDIAAKRSSIIQLAPELL
jgi:hypothetical protein